MLALCKSVFLLGALALHTSNALGSPSTIDGYFAANPTTDFKGCGMEEPSFLCDPEKIVASTGDREAIAQLLGDIEQETGVQVAVAVMAKSDRYASGDEAQAAAKVSSKNSFLPHESFGKQVWGFYSGFNAAVRR